MKIVDVELPMLPADKNVCIALSGGLDSTTLVHVLVEAYGKDRVKALSFNYGQRNIKELEMASKTAQSLGIYHDIIELEYLGKIAKNVSSLVADSDLKPESVKDASGDPQPSTYIPYRNAQFAFITAAFAESNDCRYIFNATNATDIYGYWDTTEEFKEAINNVLKLNRKNQLEFVAPFVEFYKEDELLVAKVLMKKYGNFLENTWSCYNGDLGSGKECGECNTCREKLTGYINADFEDDIILSKFNINQEELNTLKDL